MILSSKDYDEPAMLTFFMRIETVGPLSLVEGAVVELDMIIIFIFYRVVDSSKNSLN